MAISSKAKKPNGASKTSRPVTLKHLAAALAEEHQLTKRAGEALLGDSCWPYHKASQEGRTHPSCRSWHSPGQKAGCSHGAQSRNGRSDKDQSEQESRLPGGQGFEDGGLAA
jgi:hypothetical protein